MNKIIKEGNQVMGMEPKEIALNKKKMKELGIDEPDMFAS